MPFTRLIKEDMENRLAKLKLDDSANEEQLKDKQQEIEQESVSKKIPNKLKQRYNY